MHPMPAIDARVLPSNLKIRLTGVVILLVLGAAVLVTLVALVLAERDMKGVIGGQQYAVISSAAAFIDDRLDAKKQLMVSLANDLPAAARKDPNQIQAFLESRTALRTEFINLAALGRDGGLLATVQAPVTAKAISGAGKPYFEDTVTRKQAIVSAPFKGALTGSPVVLVTAPVLDENGNVEMVLAGAIDLRRAAFLRQTDLLKPGKSGFVFIMTTGGVLVAHPDKARLTQHIHQRPGINNATEMALSGYEGWIEAANKDGTDGIYSYKRLKEADWIVGARYPTDEAFAPMIAMRRHAVLGGAVVALVAGVVAWLMIYRMLAPLDALRRNVSAIRLGRAGIPPLQNGPDDEIGELGAAFHELVAERESALERTRGSERRARIIADSVPALISYINRSQRYEFANAHYSLMLGADPKLMIGKTVRETIGERSYTKIATRLEAALRGERQHFEQQVEAFGNPVYYMIDYIPDIGDDARPCGVYVLVTDISERKNAELILSASERRLKLITDNLPVLISYIDPAHNFRFGNATFETWFGVASDGMAGRSMADVFGQEAYELARTHLDDAFGGLAVTYETTTYVGGMQRIFETTFIPDVQADGSVAGVYALTHDMTRMKDVEEKLIQLARVDSLTGIANRRMFVEALHLAVERSRRQKGKGALALAYFDIDHFKKINDTYGHAIGDEVLKEFARRLAANVRATDTAARLSGDEFVVILEDLNNEQEALAVASKVAEAVRVPFDASGVMLMVTASVGIALLRAEGQSHEELLANADGALYAAKRNGRDGISMHGT
jgi:diguanylate cyclase (GGDEF)-like protein/PAS domain S-box-containing protein